MSETDDFSEKGAIERKCSKCKRPCRGHAGPYGSSWTMEFNGLESSGSDGSDETSKTPEASGDIGIIGETNANIILAQQMTNLVQL